MLHTALCSRPATWPQNISNPGPDPNDETPAGEDLRRPRPAGGAPRVLRSTKHSAVGDHVESWSVKRWTAVRLWDKTHLWVFNFWYMRLENIKTHISRHVLIRVRGPLHFWHLVNLHLKTKQKKSSDVTRQLSVCVCVYACTLVCAWECLHTPIRGCCDLISASADTPLGGQLCALLAALQERRGGGGGEWGRKGGREVRPAAFLHSFTRFLHMMRRPWIEASRLWGGRRTRERES